MSDFTLWIDGREKICWCPFGLLKQFPKKHDGHCRWSKYFRMSHPHTTMMKARPDSSTLTAIGHDERLNMAQGFNQTLIARVIKNKATDYEMVLYKLAVQNDLHFANTVRDLQLKWAMDESSTEDLEMKKDLERLRSVNNRINQGTKLPPWGDPLCNGDKPTPQLVPCRCKEASEKVPWSSTIYWSGPSNELRTALAKIQVPVGSFQATITSPILKAIKPSRRSTKTTNRSEELSALVRAAAGSTSRLKRCTKLMKERESDKDICGSTYQTKTRFNSL